MGGYLKIFKVFLHLKEEALSLLKLAVISYPNTVLGSYLRRYLWGRLFDISNIRNIGKGANIISRDKIRIGDDLILGDNVIIENANSYGCYIGNFVSIARETYIRTANHNFDNLTIPIRNQGHNAKSIDYGGSKYSVVIEDDVWIGARSIILSGAHIGKGSVISAGSVVSSKLPPYSIAGGNPARMITSRKYPI